MQYCEPFVWSVVHSKLLIDDSIFYFWSSAHFFRSWEKHKQKWNVEYWFLAKKWNILFESHFSYREFYFLFKKFNQEKMYHFGGLFPSNRWCMIFKSFQITNRFWFFSLNDKFLSNRFDNFISFIVPNHSDQDRYLIANL